MKKVLIAFVLFILLNINYAQNFEIKFYHENWKQVLEEAKKEKKLIFLDAFAVWCGPCKYMAKVVFKNDTVAHFYNANFVNAKFDMEKGEGLELAKKYQVRVYPTLLYLNSDGEVVHRFAGSMEPKDFIKEGELVLNGKHLKYYQSEFEKDNMDEFTYLVIPWIFSAGFIRTKPDYINFFRNNLLKRDTKLLLNNLVALMESLPNLPPKNPISIPTLVLQGEHDYITPASEFTSWEEGSRLRDIIVLKNAGHALSVEANDVVAKCILDFFG